MSLTAWIVLAAVVAAYWWMIRPEDENPFEQDDVLHPEWEPTLGGMSEITATPLLPSATDVIERRLNELQRK